MQLWPFNRKQDQTADIPKEVQDYYQAEKRERVGVAGLLAVGTLVATILLAMGLFFGGRWAYRSVFNNDNDNQAAQQADDTEPQEPAGPTPADTPPQPVNPPAASPPVAAAPQTQTQPQTQNRPGRASSGDLPSTGPADTARLVFSTVVLASTGYYLLGDKKRITK